MVFFVCFFDKVDITISSKSCVWRLYVLFYVCVETNFVDFEEFSGFMTFVRNDKEMD